MAKLCAVAAIASFVMSESAIAADRCLSSVCLGAPLRELKVSWDSRVTEIKENADLYAVSGVSVERLLVLARRAFPTLTEREIARIARYSMPEGGWMLDAAIFEVVAALSRVCSFDPLIGTFRSEGEHLTKVVLRPEITDRGESRFVVARIEREYEGVDPRSTEGKALIEQLRSRIGTVCARVDTMLDECDGEMIYDDYPTGMVIELRDPSMSSPESIYEEQDSERSRRLRNQEGCEMDVHIN